MRDLNFPEKTVSPLGILRKGNSDGLPVEDTLEIHELLARNYLVEDTRDEESLAMIVTQDFRQEHPLFGATVGRDGLARLLRDNPALFNGIRHQALNIATRQTGPDAAEAVHYILVFQVHPIGGKPPVPLPRPIGHGVVRDQLIKIEGQWLIRRRVYEQMSIAPDLLPDKEQRLIAAQRITASWDGADA